MDSQQENKDQFNNVSDHQNGTQDTLFTRLKRDVIYRDRILQSCWIMWTFGVFGWQSNQFGPSLLDLQTIAGVSLEGASWFVTLWMIGILVGSFLCGITFDKMDKHLFIFLTQLMMALAIAVIPWSSIFEVMLTAQFLRGVCTGLTDPAIHALLFSIWGPDGKSFIQGIHFSFAFGAILSPLATAPFLMQKLPESILPINRLCNISNNESLNIAWRDAAFFGESNKSHGYTTPLNTVSSFSTLCLLDNVTSLPLPAIQQRSRLYIAYSITTGLIIITAIPYFLYFMYKRTTDNKSPGSREQNEILTGNRTRSLPRKIFFLVLAAVTAFMSLFRSIDAIFRTFLPAVLVKQMKWSKEESSFLASFFFGMISFGRLLGIFIVKVVSPPKIVFAYSCTLLCSFIGLYVSVLTRSTIGIWVFTLLAGYGFSITYPTTLSWTDEWLISISGKVSSFIITVASIFSMIHPIFLGILIDTVTPMWFFYTMAGETAVLLSLFSAIFFLSRYVYRKYGKTYLSENGNNPDQSFEIESILKSK